MSVIYIECGTTMSSSYNTGIQRVVRNIVRESEVVGRSIGYQCVPVKFVNSNFYVIEAQKLAVQADRVGVLRTFAIKVDRLFKVALPQKLHTYIRRGAVQLINTLQHYFNQYQYGVNILSILDKGKPTASPLDISPTPPILLLLDSTWNMQLWRAVKDFRASGGRVCAVLYDLIPFTHPQTVEDHTRNAHTLWWKEAPLHLDAVMCISNSVRAEFLLWQDQQNLTSRLTSNQVGYFYLGSEMNGDSEESQFQKVLVKNEPYFLVVGSIEPRKNHELILDAFELFWQTGATANLVIVGGHGWKSEIFLKRLKAHPLYQEKLFLLTRTTDAELGVLYNKSVALIIASVAEGFGLPIVEALQHGTKVICSDIPVFREIATDSAVFFNVTDSKDLADRIAETLSLIATQPIIHTAAKKQWLTWQESTAQLISRLAICMESRSET